MMPSGSVVSLRSTLPEEYIQLVKISMDVASSKADHAMSLPNLLKALVQSSEPRVNRFAHAPNLKSSLVGLLSELDPSTMTLAYALIWSETCLAYMHDDHDCIKRPFETFCDHGNPVELALYPGIFTIVNSAVECMVSAPDNFE
ncbi:hypothetical protein EV182_007406, partial [Spiromyces aspiralis]